MAATAEGWRRGGGTVIMPFAFSSTEAIALGFIAYAAFELVSGRRRELHPLVALVAWAFLLRPVFFT